MNILEDRVGSTLVIRPVGRLDSSSSPELERKLLAHMDEGDDQILIDFVNLDYISSAGLRVLLVAAKRIRATSGRIAICGLKEHIREVFDISGFIALFEIHSDADAALSAGA